MKLINETQSSNLKFYIQYSSENLPKDYSGATHFHHCYEFFFLLENELMYLINDSVYHVKPGTVVVVPPNVIHTTRYLNPQKRRRILLHLSTDFVHSFLLDDPKLLTRLHTPPISVDKITQKKLESLLYAIMNEYDKPQMNTVLIKSFLGQLLVHLGELSKKHIHDGDINNKTTQRMMKIINYINEHYSEKITLSSLSEVFFLNPSYISRSLKNQLNVSFSEYLRTVRIKKVCNLLETTSLSLEEISEKVGLSDSSDLCRAFKTIMHTTPIKYKKTIPKY